MGMTMGRNYRYFANIHVGLRTKFAKELRAWKELNESAQNLNGEITTTSSGVPNAKEAELQSTPEQKTRSNQKEKSRT